MAFVVIHQLCVTMAFCLLPIFCTTQGGSVKFNDDFSKSSLTLPFQRRISPKYGHNFLGKRLSPSSFTTPQLVPDTDDIDGSVEVDDLFQTDLDLPVNDLDRNDAGSNSVREDVLKDLHRSAWLKSLQNLLNKRGLQFEPQRRANPRFMHSFIGKRAELLDNEDILSSNDSDDDDEGDEDDDGRVGGLEPEVDDSLLKRSDQTFADKYLGKRMPIHVHPRSRVGYSHKFVGKRSSADLDDWNAFLVTGDTNSPTETGDDIQDMEGEMAWDEVEKRPSRRYSHSFVGKRFPGYSHSFVGKRAPGYSHSFVGKRAPGYSHSFVGKRAPGYSHSFVGKRAPGYSHSFVGKRLPGYSHSFVGKRLPGYSHSFVGKRLPGYSHSFVGKRAPGYSHSFVGKRAPGYSHSFVGKRAPTYSHIFVSERAPGYSHSFVGKRAPGYSHSFVGKRTPGYSHSFVGKRATDLPLIINKRASDSLQESLNNARGYSDSFVSKRVPGYSHSFVGKRLPGYSHSFVGKRTFDLGPAFEGKFEGEYDNENRSAADTAVDSIQRPTVFDLNDGLIPGEVERLSQALFSAKEEMKRPRSYSHAFIGKREISTERGTQETAGDRKKRQSQYNLNDGAKRMTGAFVVKRDTSVSQNSDDKRQPSYSHAFVGKRHSGFSHAFVGKRQSGYSHAFVGKRAPWYNPDIIGSREIDSSDEVIGKDMPSYTQTILEKRAPGYSHAFVGKRMPGYGHSFVGKRDRSSYSHAFVGKRAPGYSHSFVGKRIPGYLHSFTGKRQPSYGHPFVGKRGKGEDENSGDDDVREDIAEINGWSDKEDASVQKPENDKSLDQDTSVESHVSGIKSSSSMSSLPTDTNT